MPILSPTFLINRVRTHSDLFFRGTIDFFSLARTRYIVLLHKHSFENWVRVMQPPAQKCCGTRSQPHQTSEREAFHPGIYPGLSTLPDICICCSGVLVWKYPELHIPTSFALNQRPDIATVVSFQPQRETGGTALQGH